MLQSCVRSTLIAEASTSVDCAIIYFILPVAFRAPCAQTSVDVLHTCTLLANSQAVVRPR
eukprot:scaffold555_cov292-Prasinococcus_capsulatus_cf.AAC.2